MEAASNVDSLVFLCRGSKRYILKSQVDELGVLLNEVTRWHCFTLR